MRTSSMRDVFVFATTYFLAQQLAFFLSPSTSVLVAVIWPAAGIGLTAFLISERKTWPIMSITLFLVGVLANLMAHRPLLASLGFMSANILESLAGAWLIQTFCGKHVKFNQVRDVVLLTVSAILINASTATIGAATAHFISQEKFFDFWKTWWVADALGLLLITPILVKLIHLIKLNNKIEDFSWTKILETVLFFVVWITVARLTFPSNGVQHDGGFPYMLIALLAWPAVRLGQIEVMVALLILSGIALTGYGVLTGPTRWGGESFAERLLLTQIFLAFTSGTGLLLATSQHETKKIKNTIQNIQRQIKEAQHIGQIGDFIFDLKRGVWDGGSELNELLGIDANYPKDIQGWLMLIGPSHREQMQMAIQRSTEYHEPLNLKCPMKQPGNKSTLWIHVYATVKNDFNGMADRLVGIYFDISTRIQMEQELAESKANFKSYFEMSTIGMCVTSPEKGWLEVNDHLCHMLGRNKEELKQLTWAELTHPDDLETDLKLFESVLTNKIDSYQLDKRFIKKDGDILYTTLCVTCNRNPDQTVNYIIASLLDITEQKIREQKYQTLFSMSYDALMTVEPPSWKFTSANPACVKLFGSRDEADFITRAPWEFSPEHQPDGLLSADKAKSMIEIAMRDGHHTFVWTHRNLKGEDFVAMVSLTKMELASKSFLQATVRDISKEQKAEQEKKQIQAQLFHSSKLASIGTLAAGVAHEINNPLAIISGYVEISRKKCTDICQHGNPDRLQKIQVAANRILKIVKGLRTYSRTDTDLLESVDIHTCIDETMSLVQTMLENESIKVKKHLNAHQFIIPANSGQLQQVIMNLLVNAKDALEKQTDATIWITTLNEEDNIVLEISDNGSGMPEQILTRIFDPFFTTKDPGKGTGLGLSVSSTIIASFGGTLTVKSAPDAGTTFKISLPLFHKKKTSLVPDSLIDHNFSVAGKVLIIDDEEGIREMLGMYLNSFGLDVTMAENGEAAYKLISKEKFDYIFADLLMPIMSGEQLIQKLNGENLARDSKFFIITGDNISEHNLAPTNLLKQRASGFIQKPFQKADLINSFKLSMT